MDDDAVPHQADLGVALHLALGDIAAGDDARAGDLVDLADLGSAQGDFLELGGQHALHGRFHLVDAVVDDAVHSHVDLGAGGRVLRVGIGADVEAHDDGVGRGGQHDVGLVDGTDGAVDDPHADLLVGQLLQGSLDGLGGALHVGLHDDVQVLQLALLDLREQIVQSNFLAGGVGGHFVLVLALLHQLAGHTLVGHGVEVVAGAGDFTHTGDLHRHGGAGLVDLPALGVGHGADTAHGGAGDDHVTLVQGAVLDQQGGHGAAALVQAGLDDSAVGGAVGVGLQLTHLGGQDDHFQQVVYAHAGLGGDGAADGVAAPLFADETVLGQLLLDALRVGFGLIHLVDGHDDGDLRGLGVVDGLHGLGHDAVVGSHHQDGDVRDHGAAGTHGGKGLVAGGVQEGDGGAVHIDLVSADVLGDAAGLALGHLGVPDIVQQGGLAVVHVAHDDHDGGAGNQVLLFVLGGVDELLLDGDDDFLLDLAAQLHGHQGGGIIVDDLRQGGHDAQLHELLDDLGAGLLHAGGQLAHADLIGDLDGEGRLLGDLQLELAHLFLLFLAALVAEGSALAVVVAALDLLLAALHPVGPLRRQGLQMLVVLIQVHVAALAGVHQLLLRYAAGGAVRGLLGLLVVLAARLGGLVVVLVLAALPVLLAAVVSVVTGAAVTGSAVAVVSVVAVIPAAVAVVPSLALLAVAVAPVVPVAVTAAVVSVVAAAVLAALGGGGQGGLHVGHLVVLGHILKDDGQLLVAEHLHVVLGGRSVCGQDLGDVLGLLAKVLGYLVYTIFILKTQIKPPP